MNHYRKDFPMLNKPFIYFNSASTSYKPKVVIDSIIDYYQNNSVNINRGVDSLGYQTTNAYENTRKITAKFLNAHKNEIVFTKGTTDSLNIIARSFGELIINENDEIITTIDEHHSNFLPWLELAKRKKAKLIIVDTLENHQITEEILAKYLTNKTKIVAINHVSNTFGAINDIKKLSSFVHKHNAYIVVDGAQGIISEEVDVKSTDIDFYAFSGHKIFGPTGVGILYGKYELLKKMEPINYGGDMVESINESVIYKLPPYKFEGGTMMIASVIGLGEAINYTNSIGIKNIHNYVGNLRNYLLEKMLKFDNLDIYNKDLKDSHTILFNVKNIHAHDVATYLDKNKIIVRAGHHCNEPLMNKLNVSSTVRLSLSIYNTKEECDKIIDVLESVGDYLNVLF